jgi:hypothetical protein
MAAPQPQESGAVQAPPGDMPRSTAPILPPMAPPQPTWKQEPKAAENEPAAGHSTPTPKPEGEKSE